MNRPAVSVPAHWRLVIPLRSLSVPTTAPVAVGAARSNVLAAASNARTSGAVVVVGATRQLFEDWESVSARVMRDLQRPVLVVPAPVRTEVDSQNG